VIPVSHGPLIHDCAITERFVVVLDLPLTLSLRTVISGRGFPYRWNSDHPARLGLLPRNGDAEDMIWIDLDPCFVFHTANAYDLPDGRVVLDVIAYDQMFSDDNEGPDTNPRGFERWTIDPIARTVAQRMVDDAPQELPRIDERRTGHPYRFAYAMGLPDEIGETLVGEAPLLKHDLEAGSRQSHVFGPGRIAGEFMFVPRGPDTAEDDGWLIGLVIDAEQTSTALEIIDARAIDQAPIGVIRLPHRVPPGIHGTWLPTHPVCPKSLP
jgi:carotenoid cleavage dioxygenase-like enzyme